MSKKHTDEELFTINPDRETARVKGCLRMVMNNLIGKASPDDLYALREKGNRLTVDGVAYTLTPAQAVALWSCYQNLKRKEGAKPGKTRTS